MQSCQNNALSTSSFSSNPKPSTPVTPLGHSDAALTVTDLSAIDEPACQPKLLSFLLTTKAKGKGRCFSYKWYDKYAWLEYSIRQDAVFCQQCHHFTKESGFRDWGQICIKHKTIKTHVAAMTKYKAFVEIKEIFPIKS